MADNFPSFKGQLDKYKNPESEKSPLYRKRMSKKQTQEQKQTQKQKQKQTTSGKETPITELPELPPLLRPGLVCVFIGFNPGIESSSKGHYYAHRSNLFWKLLYESGCVEERVTYEDDVRMMDDYRYGFHDLVLRPTKSASELSSKEMLQNVPRLEKVLREINPRIVCMVGKGIYEKIMKNKTGKSLSQFEWGVQRDVKFVNAETILVVVPSTSGLAAGISKERKLQYFKDLKEVIMSVAHEDAH